MTPAQVQVRRAATRCGSPSALATALGTSRTHVSRLLGGKQKPGIETTLRIAKINEDDPVHALEEAGHRRVADLLRDFYGSENDAKLTMRQRAVLSDLAALEDADRRHVLALVKSLAGKRESKR